MFYYNEQVCDSVILNKTVKKIVRGSHLGQDSACLRKFRWSKKFMERMIDIKNNKYAIVAAARNGHLNILK